MDNITHSLIGIAAGRGLASRFNVDDRAKAAIVWTSIVANNMPDGDIFLRPFLDGKLGYLLHHRGFSHTLLALPLLAVLSAAIGAWLTRLKPSSQGGWRPLWITGAIGILLHVFADSWNDYGVHPLSPFYNRWFYGDFFFIVEPLLWFALLPAVIVESPNRVSRVVASVLGVAMLGLVWFSGYAPLLVQAWVTLWAFAVLALQWRFRGVRVPYAAGVAVLLTFFVMSKFARQEIAERHAEAAPMEQMIQFSTSPAPGNPFCWRAIWVALSGTEGPTDYVARLGGFTLLPAIFDPRQCNFRVKHEGVAPLQDSAVESSVSMHWEGEYRENLAEMQSVFSQNCQGRELLHFARAPFWAEMGQFWVVGDLRYDAKSGNFAAATRDDQCLSAWQEPPWTPPVPVLFR